jgi:hypothetical protein
LPEDQKNAHVVVGSSTGGVEAPYRLVSTRGRPIDGRDPGGVLLISESGRHPQEPPR